MAKTRDRQQPANHQPNESPGFHNQDYRLCRLSKIIQTSKSTATLSQETILHRRTPNIEAHSWPIPLFANQPLDVKS
ncbi:hypothetical protein KOY48_03485 [Candidatus Minimicrobia naudis]|uniref:Uncharacterized protein n=1 Tax=Candidatus Minimicrobia naudis TaxID=2841263 RepID=A0A8F1MBP3_9BACT|nr:hypothetical protein KOY48_03485 [Candidatus Minimicrobia naudis]